MLANNFALLSTVCLPKRPTGLTHRETRFLFNQRVVGSIPAGAHQQKQGISQRLLLGSAWEASRALGQQRRHLMVRCGTRLSCAGFRLTLSRTRRRTEKNRGRVHPGVLSPGQWGRVINGGIAMAKVGCGRGGSHSPRSSCPWDTSSYRACSFLNRMNAVLCF